MISKEEIAECKQYCAREGYNITESDIAYLLLNREFRDKYLSYSIAKGSSTPNAVVDGYDGSVAMSCLRAYMNENWARRGSATRTMPTADNITFEENRQALIQMIADVEQLMKDRKIDAKDGMKMISDIRIKLNDKFNIKEAQVEQRIVVQPKFSHICAHTHKECWLQTERYAMEHWHLIKDPNYREDEQQS